VIAPTAGFISVVALLALPKGEAVPRGVTCTLDADGLVTVGGCCWPMTLTERLSNIVASVASCRIVSKSIRRFISLTPIQGVRRGWFKHGAWSALIKKLLDLVHAALILLSCPWIDAAWPHHRRR
jgi:hypothetical protein